MTVVFQGHGEEAKDLPFGTAKFNPYIPDNHHLITDYIGRGRPLQGE